MIQNSSGFLIFNWFDNILKVFLVHPGGPFWKYKPTEGWGIPKGKTEKGESLFETALRETKEEIGQLPTGIVTGFLGKIKQRKNKNVYAFAWKGEIIFPVKSLTLPGGFQEIEEGKWFDVKTAQKVIIKKQYIFIERLLEKIKINSKYKNRAKNMLKDKNGKNKIQAF